MSMFKKSKGQCSTVCMTTKWVLALFLFLTTIASLVGVYQTHVLIGTDPARFAMQFGSTSGSLAIIAFAISAKIWIKQIIGCMSNCEVCK